MSETLRSKAKISKIARAAALRRMANPAPQNEESYRLIAESIPQIVWTARPDGYNDHFNRRWFEYTGFTEAETYGETRSALHPDDKATYDRRWSEAIRTRKSYEIEYRLRRASDGMYRWHLGRAVPVIGADGKIMKWFGTCTDIHDQKMAEDRMRRMNEELEARVYERTRDVSDAFGRLRTIVDTMPIGMMIVDDRRSVIHCNVTFRELFGWSKPQRPGSLDELLHAMDAGGAGKGLSDFIRSAFDAADRSDDVDVRLADGRIILCSCVPIVVSGGGADRLFMFRDITRERRVDAAKSEFMSLASHQLRTPLTTIRWALNRLERQEGNAMPESKLRLVRTAKDGVIRMAETINTMLTISRIESDEVRLNPSRIPLQPLLRGLKSQFREEYVTRGQTFTIDCPPIAISTDRSFLVEVLGNLISNAVKYTPDGGRIGVTVRKRKDGVTIAVRDTGFGIPASQQPKLFSKFFRGDNILAVDPNGTGLGLYLASLITNILSGTLTCVSKENKGSTFTLRLPKSAW